ncbi:hypothetical protein EVAR_64455_1 [Eumeta japonica]|uniref:Uncharacterized protein n=1 Tax=Eumeta variegata TaxID=151549 RepID=A0A4C1ZI56_EUMVA|nr:hypothetical protein EVAR_64455_1 [Eumeta japonica]
MALVACIQEIRGHCLPFPPLPPLMCPSFPPPPMPMAIYVHHHHVPLSSSTLPCHVCRIPVHLPPIIGIHPPSSYLPAPVLPAPTPISLPISLPLPASCNYPTPLAPQAPIVFPAPAQPAPAPYILPAPALPAPAPIVLPAPAHFPSPPSTCLSAPSPPNSQKCLPHNRKEPPLCLATQPPSAGPIHHARSRNAPVIVFALNFHFRFPKPESSRLIIKEASPSSASLRVPQKF